MENLTLDAVKAVIEEAGVALKSKAMDAEKKANEAFEKAEEMLKSMSNVLTKDEAKEMQKHYRVLRLMLRSNKKISHRKLKAKSRIKHHAGKTPVDR